MPITSVFDPLFKPFSDASGLPAATYSTLVGTQLYGVLTETALDYALQPVPRVLLELILGGILSGYGTYARNLDARTREELINYGSFLLFRILNMTPEKIQAFQQNFLALQAAIQSGDAGRVVASLFRPETLGAAAQLGASVASVAAPRQAAPIIQAAQQAAAARGVLLSP